MRIVRTIPGLLVLLLLLVGSGCGETPTEANVVFIVIDTLRQDHLSSYGYPRETSPWIDRAGREGWIFDNHISQASQTVPSTITLLTSTLPAEHGYVHRFDGQFAGAPPVFRQELLFLSEVLQAEGYRTAGFAANPFLGVKNQFSQGFDHFVQHSRDAVLTTEALSWIDGGDRTQPFYLYLHYMGVHNPYVSPKRYEDRFRPQTPGRLVYVNGPVEQIAPNDLEYTKAMYDAGIRHVDDLVGVVVAHLDELGIRDETILVITSDHGDEFHEHGGLGHGTTVYGELVRVPLILSYRPKLQPGKRTSHLSQHLDVAPTLLDLLGIEVPDAFRGSSLRTEARSVFSEESAWRAVSDAGRKLIWNQETDEIQLFDLADHLDQRPLDERQPGGLRTRLEEYRAIEQASETSEEPGFRWSEEELRTLRSLGYAN